MRAAKQRKASPCHATTRLCPQRLYLGRIALRQHASDATHPGLRLVTHSCRQRGTPAKERHRKGRWQVGEVPGHPWSRSMQAAWASPYADEEDVTVAACRPSVLPRPVVLRHLFLGCHQAGTLGPAGRQDNQSGPSRCVPGWTPGQGLHHVYLQCLHTALPPMSQTRGTAPELGERGSTVELPQRRKQAPALGHLGNACSGPLDLHKWASRQQQMCSAACSNS